MKKQRFLDRLASVKNECGAATLGVERLRQDAAHDPTILEGQDFESDDLLPCLRNLESTYLVRLFAEFEACLRLYWREVRRRPTWKTIGAEVLIQSVAAYEGVPDEFVDAVQAVREFRNALVHQPEARETRPLALAECRTRLGRFLSYLPARW